MPRPNSKDQLLEQAQQRYTILQTEVAKLSPEEIVESGTVGEWSVKDVLAHLLAWHQMVLAWHRAGKRGEVPITPSEKYTWREIPALNQEIYETHRDWPLDKVSADFAASHQEVMQEIEALSNDELFTPKVYTWTKSTTLGSYFISATGSHYDWACKEIRRGIKAKRKQQA